MSIAIRPVAYEPKPTALPAHDPRPRPPAPRADHGRAAQALTARDSRAAVLRALHPGAARSENPVERRLRAIQQAPCHDDLIDLRERVERMPEGPERSHLLAACAARWRALDGADAKNARARTVRARAAVAELKNLGSRKDVSVAREFERAGELLESLPKTAETAALKRTYLDAAAAYTSAHQDDDSITLTRTLLLRPIRQSMAKVLSSDAAGIMTAYTGELDPEAGDARYHEVTEPLAGVMKSLLDDHGTVAPFADDQQKIDKEIAVAMAELVKAGDPRFLTLVSASAQGYLSIAQELAEADQSARDRLSSTLGLALHAVGGSVGVHGWQAIAGSAVGHEIMHELLPEGSDRFGEASDDVGALIGRAQHLLDLFRAPDRELDRAVNDRVGAVHDGASNAVAAAERLASTLRARLQAIETISAAGVRDPHVQRALERERENIRVALGSLDAASGRSKQSPGTAGRAEQLLDELAGIDGALARAGADTAELAALRVRRLEAQVELRRLLSRLNRRGEAKLAVRAQRELAPMAGSGNAIVERLSFLEGAIHDSEPGLRRDALLTEARGLLDLLELEIGDIESLVAGERARRDEGAAAYGGDDAFLSLGSLNSLQREADHLRRIADGFLRVSRIGAHFG